MADGVLAVAVVHVGRVVMSCWTGARCAASHIDCDFAIAERLTVVFAIEGVADLVFTSSQQRLLEQR